MSAVTSPTAPSYLAPKEAARHLGVSLSFLAKLRCCGEGRGPVYVKLGHAVRYQREALDLWARSQARTTVKAAA